MALKSDLLFSSLPPAAANKLGFDSLQSVTAAGSTQGTATSLNTNCANVTTSIISSGVIITAPIEYNYIYNSGPNTLTVYPPVGSNFLGLAANVGVQVAVNVALETEGAGTTLLASLSGVIG